MFEVCVLQRSNGEGVGRGIYGASVEVPLSGCASNVSFKMILRKYKNNIKGLELTTYTIS